VAQLYSQALSTHFSRLLRHAWAIYIYIYIYIYAHAFRAVAMLPFYVHYFYIKSSDISSSKSCRIHLRSSHCSRVDFTVSRKFLSVLNTLDLC
jgi:hypothetical protein